MKRRSFFKSLAKAAAIVALAPQIAFRVKALDLTPQKVAAGYVAYWMQTTRYSACVDAEYAKVWSRVMDANQDLKAAIKKVPCGTRLLLP